MQGSTPFAVLALSIVVGLCAVRAQHDEVRAGDYHDGATLDCAECHVMHAAATKKSASAASLDTHSSDMHSVGALLKRDVNDLCLACHDGSQRAADVLGLNQGRYPSDIRQAGALNRLGRDGEAGTGHTLDALDTAPGSSTAWNAERENGAGGGLNCINCHAPHGRQGERSAYRNLRGDAGGNASGAGLVTYNDAHAGVNDLTRDVFVRRPLRFDEAAVDFNEPENSDSALGRFCAGCHDNFHGVPGVDADIGGHVQGRGLAGFVRHPSAGVDIGALGGEGSSAARFAARRNRVKVMSSIGVWDGTSPGLTPTCISCHKAHGNRNAFGLIYRSGTGTLTEEGDSRGTTVEALCGQCHDTNPL